LVTQNIEQLNAEFAIPEVLRFEVVGKGLIKSVISTGACDAELFLQGAHLTKWQPKGALAVLYLSERTFYEPGKAIRGGVPIIFPWFGSRSLAITGGTTDGPSHGFARTALWTVATVGMKNDTLELTLTLAASPSTNVFAIDDFLLEYRISLGPRLELDLVVHNLSPSRHLSFEEALHTYLNVGDATRISLSGLQGFDFIDKTDGFKRKHQDENLLTLRAETDSPYLNFQGSVMVHDPVFGRDLIVEKENSSSTVIWNPWQELSSKLPDMSSDGWKNMVCVETANVSENLIDLGPNQSHQIRTWIKM